MLEFSRPPIKPADVEAAAACLSAGRLDPGPAAEAFRKELAALVGVPADWVALTGSCTQALRACWHYLGRRRVVAPALTWPGTYCWADPSRLELGDVCADGFFLGYHGDEDYLAVPVELWGRRYPLERLGSSRVAGMRVVVDAAHNLAALHHKWWVENGEVDAVCYSFAPVKQVTTIRGGAVVAQWAAELARWLHAGTENRMPMQNEGDNARMTEVGAALGLGQLRRHRQSQRRRQAILRAYARAGLKMLTTPGHSGHLAVAAFPDWREACRAAMKLEKAGVNTGKHYNVFGPYPSARAVSDRVLTLPCHLSMTPADARRVIAALRG